MRGDKMMTMMMVEVGDGKKIVELLSPHGGVGRFFPWLLALWRRHFHVLFCCCCVPFPWSNAYVRRRCTSVTIRRVALRACHNQQRC